LQTGAEPDRQVDLLERELAYFPSLSVLYIARQKKIGGDTRLAYFVFDVSSLIRCLDCECSVVCSGYDINMYLPTLPPTSITYFSVAFGQKLILSAWSSRNRLNCIPL
jgi:hypothetical protein